MTYEDTVKKWNSSCPECNSPIIWSPASGRPGAEASAICANNMTVSINIPINQLRNHAYCFWRGAAVRQKDQSVRIKNLDNSWLNEHYRKNNVQT